MRGSEKHDREGDRVDLGRRGFVVGMGAAAAAFSLAGPGAIRGYAANSKIALGAIGCGGRGKWIADLFVSHGGYEVVAGADYFQDRVDEFGEKFGVPASRRYTGLSCYKKLLESGVDAVAIESPPYFHPEQAAAAVDAGCHVYLAKPIAVDVPGCRSISESGQKAASKKLCFLVDFQTRANDYYREAVKKVHEGAIGPVASGEASYHCGRLGIQAEPGTPEARLRNWVFDIALSGDIITEQNIHALDVATWILDAEPEWAYATGGRRVRTDVGDCWDHFAGVFRFPGDILLTFNSKQFGEGYSDILCRMYGPEGAIDTHYGGEVCIRGKVPYEGGKTDGIYKEGALRNIGDFHDGIMKGDFSNSTVSPSVRSNLTTILGRSSAYRKREMTWQEMMQANEKLEANLAGLAG